MYVCGFHFVDESVSNEQIILICSGNNIRHLQISAANAGSKKCLKCVRGIAWSCSTEVMNTVFKTLI